MIALSKTVVDGVRHLFFPHLCAACGTDILDREQLLCLRCLDELPYTGFHLYANNPVEKIFWGRVPIVAAASVYYFTKQSLLQELIHQLKYQRNKDIGFYLGTQMGRYLKSGTRFETVDALVPVPLFNKREHQRGYNQAAVLCTGIAEALHVPVWTDVIGRRMRTETQTHKHRDERWQNINDRFELKNSDRLIGKHVLLVDDVVTTGATLDACASTLLQATNASLSIATLAYTSL